VTDRRAAFFLFASAVSFALTPVADPEHRFVAIGLGVIYLLLAIGSSLDARSRGNAAPRRSRRDSDERF
jgi:hypothetical protein